MNLFLLILMPAVAAMAYAVINAVRRNDVFSVCCLCVISLLASARFVLIALHFGGLDYAPWMNVVESLASMYVIPAMYIFLCDQCGTSWKNMESAVLVCLPLVTFIPGLGDSRTVVVVTMCIVVTLCMIRLAFRIHKYGLKPTTPLIFYYLWMFTLLGFTAYSFIFSLHESELFTQRIVFIALYSVLITLGFAFIPYSFKVSAIVEDNGTPVHLDAYMETNRRLEVSLRKLMEEDKIFLTPSIYIDDLAQMMNTNRTYVTRLMRQVYGQSYTDYVNQSRVEYSKQLLLTTKMGVEDIAMASGFLNASSYCRVFKRLENNSPIAWRNSQKI